MHGVTSWGPQRSDKREAVDIPSDPGAVRLVDAATFLLQRGDLSQAIGLLTSSSLSLKPALNALRRVGHGLWMQRRFHEGTHFLKAAIAAGYGTTETNGWLGLFARHAGQGEVAHAAFTNAVEKGDPGAWVCHHAAMNAHALGRLDEAMAFAEQAAADDPRSITVRAAADSIRAAIEASRLPIDPARRRIVLHMNQEFHYWILRPVFQVLRDHHDVILNDDPLWVHAFDPDFVFVGDAQAGNMRSYAPRATFIQTRHGLISKNHAIDMARQCDFVCVSGPLQRDFYVDKGGFEPERVWETGYPQMDPLFRREAPAPPFSLRTEVPCVLYAPTFTPGLSSVDMLGDDMAERLIGGSDGLDLILKPHPAIRDRFPTWYAWFERSAGRPHVHLVEEPEADIMPFLQRADVLVSDASSAAFQFLALDRPIVLIDNPRRQRSPAYDPKGIEWTRRDVAERVEDIDELAATIERVLAEPEARSAQRAAVRDELFGNFTDGRAGERILEHVHALIDGSVRD